MGVVTEEAPAPPVLYVATSAYLVDAATVGAALAEHRSWVGSLYRDGVMLASGPKVGGGGGVLILRAADHSEAAAIVEADPFTRLKVAAYEITAFLPTPEPQRHPAIAAFFEIDPPTAQSDLSGTHGQGADA